MTSHGSRFLLRRVRRWVFGASVALVVLFGAPTALAAVLAPGAADGSPPVISATVTGTPGANGWYTSNVTVAWSVDDPESGISETTRCDVRTFTQDTTGISRTCSATNGVGLSGSYTVTVRLDKTPPSVSPRPARTPDSGGWYNHAVSVAFAGSDATSGIGWCSSAAYSGPDTSAASVAGMCRDVAGNEAGSAFGLRYDATAPSVTASADRAPNAAGWYGASVRIVFSGSDAMSGVASCDAPTYGGPDSAGASVTGGCRDVAGNWRTRAHVLKYDATSPAVSGATPSRPLDTNGWYNRPVILRFAGSDATSGIESCDASTYGGPDAASASVTGRCRDRAGNERAASSPAFAYDATAPAVTGIVPERAPDANGWYNRPVAFSASGSDATSGIESCDPGRYEGPDGKAARASAACRDRAGNVGTGAFPLDYDATPPVVEAVPDRRPDRYGWYGRDVRFTFLGRDAASGIASCSAPIAYGGPNSERASVAGTCVDLAGNRGAGQATFAYTEPLLRPGAGARVTLPPVLRWVTVAGARHYNVQLWRAGRKLLTAWPRRSELRLARRWTFRGRPHELSPGRYAWYVWPRFASGYGGAVGRSWFVVRS